jgi:hypothetical protein
MQPTIEMLSEPIPISDAEMSGLTEISRIADDRRCFLGCPAASQ